MPSYSIPTSSSYYRGKPLSQSFGMEGRASKMPLRVKSVRKSGLLDKQLCNEIRRYSDSFSQADTKERADKTAEIQLDLRAAGDAALEYVHLRQAGSSSSLVVCSQIAFPCLDLTSFITLYVRCLNLYLFLHGTGNRISMEAIPRCSYYQISTSDPISHSPTQRGKGLIPLTEKQGRE